MLVKVKKRKKPKIALDTETTGVNVWKGDEPFCFSFCREDGDSFCFRWEVDPWTRVVIPNPRELEECRKIFESRDLEKVYHNAKFDIRICEQAFGWRHGGIPHDTMYMAHIANTLEPSFGLKELGIKYLDVPNDDQQALMKAVHQGRRVAEKLGWTLAYEYHYEADGTISRKAQTAADYWIPGQLDPKNKLCEAYAIKDAERTMLLFAMYSVGLEEMGLVKVYEEERELWPITYQMESRGVRIDLQQVEIEVKAMQAELARHEEEVVSRAWKGFNIRSPKQLGVLLYEKEKLPIKKRTAKTGAPQVSLDAILEHQGNPVVDSLLRFNAAKNGLTNFFLKYRLLALPDPLNEGGSCLRPDFHQIGPVTGRFSCRSPNLQNVANALTTRSPVPIQARTPFGPRPGYVWYGIDYSQLEVRIFADVSQEPTMLEAIATGRDLHTECTNKAWGGKDNPAAIRAAIHALELDGTGDHSHKEIQRIWREHGLLHTRDLRKLNHKDKEKIAEAWLASFGYDIVKAEKSLDKKTSRAKAKMILFAKIFGGGPNAIKDLLWCTYDEALQFLADYDTAFPQIVSYISELSSQGRRDGFIINRYGRRIGVSPEFPYRAVNYMVQGSAADLLKRSMRETSKFLKKSGADAHIVLSIHDEIMFEIRRTHATRKLLGSLVRIMEDHGGAFGVSTPVEVKKILSSWNETQDAIL